MADASQHVQQLFYQCDKCTKSYNRESSLRKHRLLHDTEKKFTCAQCNAKFTYKDSLTQHLISHTNTAQYICPQSGKKYKHRATLTRHVALHNTNPRYACEVCNKKFDRKSYLLEHLEVHIGKEVCSHCQKSVYHLSQHLQVCRKVVPGQMKYFCNVCSKKFAMRRYLNEHKKCAHDTKEQYVCAKCGNKKIFGVLCSTIPKNVRPKTELSMEHGFKGTYFLHNLLN